MQSKEVMQAIDRTFRDIMGNSSPFGGKVIVMTGDWRQTLPCSADGRTEIVGSCHTKSYLWPYFTVHHLNRNMRLARCENTHNAVRLRAFDEFLCRLGDGDEGIEGSISNGRIVHLPEEIVYTGSKTPAAYSAHVFSDLPALLVEATRTFLDADERHDRAMEVLRDGNAGLIAADARRDIQAAHDRRLQAVAPLAKYLENRAIVACLNSTVAELNDAVSEMICTDERLYTASNVSADTTGQGLHLATEDLAKMVVPGMADHYLKIKPLMVVMLMRNLCARKGLCNGTRAIVLQTLDTQLHVMILGGRFANTTHFIPYINFQDDRGWSFQLKRTQLPVRAGFAMTVRGFPK